jgi:hypothetical protein
LQAVILPVSAPKFSYMFETMCEEVLMLMKSKVHRVCKIGM